MGKRMSAAQFLTRHLVSTSPVLTEDRLRHLRDAEGFRGMPYDDSLGKPTIGVGTLLPITPDEGELLAACRQVDTADEVHDACSRVDAQVMALPPDVWDCLYDMAYQLGVPKLMQFRKMWAAIERKDWKAAADEALDSKWARQTPKRAEHVAAVFRSHAGG